jgi:hypothetical protein
MKIRFTVSALVACSLLAIGGFLEQRVAGGVKIQGKPESCPLINLGSMYSKMPDFNLYLSQEVVKADWHRARAEGVLDASYECRETFNEDEAAKWVVEKVKFEASKGKMRLKSEPVTIKGWRGQHWWVEVEPDQVDIYNQDQLGEGYFLYRGKVRIALTTSPGNAHLDAYDQGKRNFFARFTDEKRLPVTLPVQGNLGWMVQDQEGRTKALFPGHPNLNITSWSTDEGASLEEDWVFDDGTAEWQLKIVHRLFGGKPVTRDSLSGFVEKDHDPCLNGCIIPPKVTSDTFRGDPAFLRRYTIGTPPSQDSEWSLVPKEGREIAFFHRGKIVKFTVLVELEDKRSADAVMKEFLNTLTFKD